MDFGLSEEQEMLQETVRGFVNNECPVTKLREIFDSESGHDAGLWSGLVEMGIAGLAIPDCRGNGTDVPPDPGQAARLLDFQHLVAEALQQIDRVGSRHAARNDEIRVQGQNLLGEAVVQHKFAGLRGQRRFSRIRTQPGDRQDMLGLGEHQE